MAWVKRAFVEDLAQGDKVRIHFNRQLADKLKQLGLDALSDMMRDFGALVGRVGDLGEQGTAHIEFFFNKDGQSMETTVDIPTSIIERYSL